MLKVIEKNSMWIMLAVIAILMVQVLWLRAECNHWESQAKVFMDCYAWDYNQIEQYQKKYGYLPGEGPSQIVIEAPQNCK